MPAKKSTKKVGKKTAKKVTAKKAAPKKTAKHTTDFKHLAPFLEAVSPNVANNTNFCTTSGRNAFKAANRTSSGKVRFEHVDKRTRAMLFCQHGLTHINPTAPLLTPAQRVQLKGPINTAWFDDVQCNISNEALTKADTLNKLEVAIYQACALKE